MINKDYRLEATQIIGEISALAFMVNTFTEYAVFFDFSGHVDLLSIKITRSKSEYANILTSDDIRIGAEEWSNEKRVIKELIYLKLQLKKILYEKKINYSGLNYSVRKEKDYHLL